MCIYFGLWKVEYPHSLMVQYFTDYWTKLLVFATLIATLQVILDVRKVLIHVAISSLKLDVLMRVCATFSVCICMPAQQTGLSSFDQLKRLLNRYTSAWCLAWLNFAIARNFDPLASEEEIHWKTYSPQPASYFQSNLSHQSPSIFFVMSKWIRNLHSLKLAGHYKFSFSILFVISWCG